MTSTGLRHFKGFTLEFNISHIMKKLSKTCCVIVAVSVGIRLVICLFIDMGENQLLLWLQFFMF